MLTKNTAEKDRLDILVVPMTVNQQSCRAVAVVQEICHDLNMIVLCCAKPPHPIITPPSALQILYASCEMVPPKVDYGVEVIHEVPVR